MTGANYAYPTAVTEVGNSIALMQLLNTATPIIQNPTSLLNSSASSALSGIVLPSAGQQGLTQPELDSLTAVMSQLSGGLTDFQTHTNGHITNMTSRMGQADSFLHLKQTTNPQSSICDSLNNFFGSVMGAGAALLGQIMSVINQIIAAILNSTLAQAILGIIATIAGLVAGIAAMIANEIAALASALSQLLNFALGSLFASLGGNSCLKLLRNAVGTAAMLNITG